MTQLRHRPDTIANRMDRRLAGVGPRRAAFMDLDACTHDRETGRLLVQEFKTPDEGMSAAQRETLTALAGLPGVTVWWVQEQANGLLRLTTVTAEGREIGEDVTETGYAARVSQWWRAGG